jgi:hypothetical protein
LSPGRTGVCGHRTPLVAVRVVLWRQQKENRAFCTSHFTTVVVPPDLGSCLRLSHLIRPRPEWGFLLACICPSCAVIFSPFSLNPVHPPFSRLPFRITVSLSFLNHDAIYTAIFFLSLYPLGASSGSTCMVLDSLFTNDIIYPII